MADVMMDIVNRAKATLVWMDDELEKRKWQVVEVAHKQMGVRRSYVCLAGLLSVLGFIFFGFGAAFLVNVIGFTWPAYQTFKAIDDKDDSSEDKFWLRYWVCFGVISLADSCMAFLLMWIPFYNIIKVALIIYLFFPTTRGANHMYDLVIQPVLRLYRPQIEAGIRTAVSAAKGAISVPEVDPELETTAWDGVDEADSAYDRSAASVASSHTD